jgi:hypothetical protein
VNTNSSIIELLQDASFAAYNLICVPRKGDDMDGGSANSTALTVTFDTNTLAAVVSPEDAQLGNGPFGATVRAAMQAGRVRGFFSETLVTVEGIKNTERSDVLGKGLSPFLNPPAIVGLVEKSEFR